MGKSTFTADGTAPFVFDDNWDNFGNLRPESRRLSATNADGVPVVPLTDEQKCARPWTNADVPRLAIFNQYNGIGSRFHWWEPPHELLDAMPLKRRSLFRHAYGEAANTGLGTRNLFDRALG